MFLTQRYHSNVCVCVLKTCVYSYLAAVNICSMLECTVYYYNRLCYFCGLEQILSCRKDDGKLLLLKNMHEWVSRFGGMWNGGIISMVEWNSGMAE